MAVEEKRKTKEKKNLQRNHKTSRPTTGCLIRLLVSGCDRRVRELN